MGAGDERACEVATGVACGAGDEARVEGVGAVVVGSAVLGEVGSGEQPVAFGGEDAGRHVVGDVAGGVEEGVGVGSELFSQIHSKVPGLSGLDLGGAVVESDVEVKVIVGSAVGNDVVLLDDLLGGREEDLEDGARLVAVGYVGEGEAR